MRTRGDVHALPPGCELSVSHGGPFYRVARLLRLDLRAREPRHNAVAALVAIALGWAPTVLLAAGHYLAAESWEPLVLKSEIHVRLLVSLPLLLLAEASLENRVGSSVRHLVTGGVIPDERLDAWRAKLARLALLRDAWWPEAMILGAVYGVTLASYLGGLPEAVLRWLAPAIHTVSSGWTGATAAWWWYVLVGQPLFLFVVGRWLVRWALWSRTVWAVSEQEPHLLPAHADEAGGLAFLASPLFSFRFFSLALGFALMSVWYDEIAQHTASPATFSADLLTFVTLSLSIALVPYLRLTPLLIDAKRETEHAYSVLMHRYVDAFQARWFEEPARPDEILGNADFQSLADIGNAFSVVRRMRATVFDRMQVLALLMCMLAPFLVIVLTFVVPATELVKLIAKRMLG